MIIDVLVSSCARPDVLDISMKSFKRHVKTDLHDFRFILIEDKVDSKERQVAGLRWILDNVNKFDQIRFLRKKAGKGFWWQEALKLCNSDFHIHLEDDNEFIIDINVDKIINVMKKNDDIVEIIFNRKKVKGETHIIDEVELTRYDSFSIATGIFNTKNTNDILDYIGRDKEVHEYGNLRPASDKLNLKRFVLGNRKLIHYNHLGEKFGYKKGSWKNAK